MRRPLHLATVAAAAASFYGSLAVGSAQAACKADVLLELPVTLVRSKALVPARINESEVTVIVDTGAVFSGMTAQSAQSLGLAGRPVPANLHFGPGAWKIATAQTFALGPMVIRNADFLVGGRIANVGAAARIGANNLAVSTVEFDFADHALRFLKLQDCQGSDAAYWAKGAGVSTVALDPAGPGRPQPRGAIEVNGVPVHVMFDTGAPDTFISHAAAARAGVDLSASATQAAPAFNRAVGGEPVPVVQATVKSLRIGDEERRDQPLQVADSGAAADHEGLVGMDFFLTHRVLLDRAQNRLYITRAAN